MSTESELQAKHAALFKRVSDHLAVTAGKLTRLSGETRLSPLDVANLFLGTAANVLDVEAGRAAAVSHLRELADRIEQDDQAKPN